VEIGLARSTFKAPTEQQIQRTNQLQRNFFSRLIRVFDPPLPEGVPERLKQIVASAKLTKSDAVLDVGTGTGILVPLIQAYEPEVIFACDLSESMLAHLQEQYPYVKTIAADVRDLMLPDQSIDIVFLNACYPNIADKPRSFENISRMTRPGGRMVISHPMGKSFIDLLREESPFALDDFPKKSEAEALLEPSGFLIQEFIDEPMIYILVATRQNGC
jgi:ubiquinone/menaquinone biosynthesis C-methylase UbiE